MSITSTTGKVVVKALGNDVEISAKGKLWLEAEGDKTEILKSNHDVERTGDYSVTTLGSARSTCSGPGSSTVVGSSLDAKLGAFRSIVVGATSDFKLTNATSVTAGKPST